VAVDEEEDAQMLKKKTLRTRETLTDKSKTELFNDFLSSEGSSCRTLRHCCSTGLRTKSECVCINIITEIDVLIHSVMLLTVDTQPLRDY